MIRAYLVITCRPVLQIIPLSACLKIMPFYSHLRGMYSMIIFRIQIIQVILFMYCLNVFCKILKRLYLSLIIKKTKPDFIKEAGL